MTIQHRGVGWISSRGRSIAENTPRRFRFRCIRRSTRQISKTFGRDCFDTETLESTNSFFPRCISCSASVSVSRLEWKWWTSEWESLPRQPVDKFINRVYDRSVIRRFDWWKFHVRIKVGWTVWKYLEVSIRTSLIMTEESYIYERIDGGARASANNGPLVADVGNVAISNRFTSENLHEDIVGFEIGRFWASLAINLAIKWYRWVTNVCDNFMLNCWNLRRLFYSEYLIHVRGLIY